MTLESPQANTSPTQEFGDLRLEPNSDFDFQKNGTQKRITFDVVEIANEIPKNVGEISISLIFDPISILRKRNAKEQSARRFADALYCQKSGTGLSKEGGRIRKSMQLFESGIPPLLILERVVLDRKLEKTAALAAAAYKAAYEIVASPCFEECMPFVVWDGKNSFSSRQVGSTGRTTSRRTSFSKFKEFVQGEKIIGTDSLYACGRLPLLRMDNVTVSKRIPISAKIELTTATIGKMNSKNVC